MRKAMYLMGALEDGDIEWLAVNGAVQRLTQGQALMREGVDSDSLFVVLDGQFAVDVGGTRVTTLLAGEIVGEISFVDGRPPSATVTALDAARILAVGREALRTKFSADPRFAAHFYFALAAFLADRLRTTTARLAHGDGVATEDADELSEALMETVSLGTQRFDKLLRRLRGG